MIAELTLHFQLELNRTLEEACRAVITNARSFRTIRCIAIWQGEPKWVGDSHTWGWHLRTLCAASTEELMLLAQDACRSTDCAGKLITLKSNGRWCVPLRKLKAMLKEQPK